MKSITSIFLLLLVRASLIAQDVPLSDRIRLNQVGYYPSAPKVAVIISENEKEFSIYTNGQKQKVFIGKLSEARLSPFSSKKTQLANFSSLTKAGQYVLVIKAIGKSYPFEIKDNIHDAVARASIKAFYYQRLSTSLSAKYAGKWHRAAGHPDDRIIIHPSAATNQRPAGSIIASPRGWFDAGDYNKYIVNSGITMGTLLSAYEDFPAYYDALKLNVPESSNTVPDLLDEVLWNLRWMLTMQDEDGGVYNKLTNANFDKMVMPDQATTPRYVVQKGTAATLDFAAVTAQAARVFKKFDTTFPGLADSCLTASKKGWAWAIKNPNVEYNQKVMNTKYDPDISTGGYGDKNFNDEFIWAAAELYATTHDEGYRQAITLLPDTLMPLPSWPQVRLLGYYSLVRLQKELPPAVMTDISEMKKRIVQFSDELLKGTTLSPFATVMGSTKSDFVWGSNSVAANQSIALLQSYRLTNEKKYLHAALGNLDYLLGRNGTGYSFVTGHGDKTPMHPHHRPSEADGVDDPVPGMLVGGPNPGRQDKCNYPSVVDDEAYIDETCSYASNEIAINWNASLVYLAGALEALQM